MTAPPALEIPRVDPGVEGLALLSNGGLPAERMTLVGGTAGSGKTIIAVQFLAAGIKAGEPGVFVSFEERPAAIRRNVRSFGWDVATWEEAGSVMTAERSKDYGPISRKRPHPPQRALRPEAPAHDRGAQAGEP